MFRTRRAFYIRQTGDGIFPLEQFDIDFVKALSAHFLGARAKVSEKILLFSRNASAYG